MGKSIGLKLDGLSSIPENYNEGRHLTLEGYSLTTTQKAWPTTRMCMCTHAHTHTNKIIHLNVYSYQKLVEPQKIIKSIVAIQLRKRSRFQQQGFALNLKVNLKLKPYFFFFAFDKRKTCSF